MKFEIYRTDTDKRVLAPTEFRDAESAAGQYICALVIAGILKRADDYTHNGGESYTLKNGWRIEVRAA